MIFKSLLTKIKRFFAPPGYFEVESLDFSADDLFINPEQRGSSLFLGKYSLSEIEIAMKHFGIFSYLKSLGYYPVKIYSDCTDSFKHRLVLYIDSLTPQNILVECVLQKKLLHVHDVLPNYGEVLPFLSIEWLLLQHPRGKFSAEKPRLPNQTFPGLGIGKKILTLLKLVSMDLNLAGLVNVPEYFHNAAMYSRRFFFLSGMHEAMVRKLNSTLVKEYGLSTISWAIERRCIYLNDQEFKWTGSPQIIPGYESLKSYFHSDNYKAELRHEMAKYTFTFDVNEFVESLRKVPISGFSEFCNLLKSKI